MNVEKGRRLVAAVDDMQKVSDDADLALETEMSEESEKEFDRAYLAYWQAVNDLAAYLTETVPGLDETAAKKMALHKRDEIKALFDRAQ